MSTQSTRGQVLRFLVVGSANTICTTIAFYFLALILPTRVAFTIVYLAGLAFVVVVTPSVVFGASASMMRRALLAGWYLVTYGVGLAVISVLAATTDVDRLVVVLVTVTITAPMGFL